MSACIASDAACALGSSERAFRKPGRQQYQRVKWQRKTPRRNNLVVVVEARQNGLVLGLK
jgi:hypothetical protein